MNPLLRLYPAWWRERYAAEMSALLKDLQTRDLPARGRLRLAADLIRGALDARFALAPEAAMESSSESASESASATPAGATALRQPHGTLRFALILALAVWALLSVDIVLTNVVFPSGKDDDTVGVMVAYGAVFATMALTGYLAVRRGGELKTAAVCGAVAGAVIGVLTIGTFLAVDNIWLDIVSRQPQKIQSLAQSGGGSMRAYINRSLLPALVVMPVLLGAFGAVFGVIGGAVGLRRSTPRRTA